VLAHITGWDEASTASLRAYVEDREEGIVAYRGINEYNTRSVETRQDLMLEHIIREWEHAREEVKAAFLAVPDEKMSGQALYPWGTRARVVGLITTLIDHEKEHAEEITGKLSENK
jgi:hypothetical protein